VAEVSGGKPYEDNGDVRTILASVDPSELVWHRDSDERYITVLEGQGWQLQYNGWLPILLEEGQTYHIPAELYHRVILGATNLKILIKSG